MDYAVEVSRDLMARTKDPHPSKRPRETRNEDPSKTLLCKRACLYSESLSDCQRLAVSELEEDHWGEGTKGPFSSRFARVIFWMANGLVQGKTMEVPCHLGHSGLGLLDVGTDGQ
jgi:hypothetical protein